MKLGPVWAIRGSRIPCSSQGKDIMGSSSSPEKKRVFWQGVGRVSGPKPGSCGLGQGSKSSRELECQMGAEQAPSHTLDLSHMVSLDRNTLAVGYLGVKELS